jgi:hypothetical protein
MLRIAHVEEIADLLLSLPNLVQQQEQRSGDFVANVTEWLRSLERAFTASRLYQAGSIAVLRSSLLAAEQGQMPAEVTLRGRPSRSRVSVVAASQALQRAAEVASALIVENQPRLAEAERFAHQIVTVALSHDLIAVRENGVSNTQYLQALWRGLVANGELTNAVAHLEGLVGPHDALVVLDRALAQHVDAHMTDPSTTLPSSG